MSSRYSNSHEGGTSSQRDHYQSTSQSRPQNSRYTQSKRGTNQSKPTNLPPLSFPKDSSTDQNMNINQAQSNSQAQTPSCTIHQANLDFFNDIEYEEMPHTGRPTTSRSSRRPNTSHHGHDEDD